VAACLLLRSARFAKSAQLPLHTWLPDADGGPDPGLGPDPRRTWSPRRLPDRPLPTPSTSWRPPPPTSPRAWRRPRSSSPPPARSWSRPQTDHRLLDDAQIGYMCSRLQPAGYDGGLFHLMTHAFFKALLFMAAGSVDRRDGGIQDIQPDGRLRQGDPFTFITFTVGGWRWPASRRCPAGSPRTRSSASTCIAAATTWCGDRRLRERAPHRLLLLPHGVPVFYGDPVPEASSLERGSSRTAST